MGSVEYAHARLAARYGKRPGAAQWHRIEHARTLGALLEAVRGTAFGDLVTALSVDDDAHAVEALLRRRWRALVGEVASWVPQRWQAAVRWCAVLPDLPVLAHAARAGARPRWIEEDPLYRDVAAGGPAAASPFAPLASAWTAPEALGAAWHREFRRRVAAGDGGPLPAIERAVLTHLAAFRGTDLDDGTPLRRRLEEVLAVLFRRAALTPAEAFAFLAIALIDLERLRGELLRRVVFPRRSLVA